MLDTLIIFFHLWRKIDKKKGKGLFLNQEWVLHKGHLNSKFWNVSFVKNVVQFMDLATPKWNNLHKHCLPIYVNKQENIMSEVSYLFTLAISYNIYVIK